LIKSPLGGFFESSLNKHLLILFNNKLSEGIRSSRLEQTAYLARLFMSPTHCSVNKNEATGLVANPGAIATRCETSFPLGHINDAEESRLD
jgi:hypothetical protein